MSRAESLDGIDLTRGLATFAVVFLHASAFFVLSYPTTTNSWQVSNFYDASVRWCVPFFVIISGSLLLTKGHGQCLHTFYRSRSKKIVIPTVFWTLFYAIWNLSDHFMHFNFPMLAVVKKIISGSPHYHLWFMYMIVILYVFTPFLRKLVNCLSESEMIILLYVGFALSRANSNFCYVYIDSKSFYINDFLLYIPYYLFGYYVVKFQPSYLYRSLVPLFASCFFLTFIGCDLAQREFGLTKALYFYDYLSIPVVGMSLSLFLIIQSLAKSVASISTISHFRSFTFGIYLVHPLYFDVVRNMVPSVYSFNPIISVPLLSVAVFLLSLVTVASLSKVPIVKRIV